MSDGGLLQKAMDVQQPADEIVAVAAPEVEKKTLIPNSLFIGMGLAGVSIVSMWLYSLPSIQSDYAFDYSANCISGSRLVPYLGWSK